jgi:hypothetical protein
VDGIATRAGRACLLLSLGLLGLAVSRVAPLPPVGTDGLIYHLTLPAMWIQGDFAGDLPFHDSAAEHAPFLGEAIWWLLMRATGDDTLVWIVPPLFLALTLRWLYLAARFLGARRPLALAATAHAAAFFPFAAAVQVANTDLLLTAGAAWALFGLARARPQPRAGAVSLAGGVALMVASKYIGLVYALAAVAAAAVVWKGWRRPGGRWPRASLPGASVAAVFAAAFLGRNLFAHGNPFYPQAFLGLPSLYDTASLRVEPGEIPAALRLLLDSPAVGAALWLGALPCAASRRARPVAVFVAAAALLYFLLVPFWTEARLLLPVFLALHLAAAAGLAHVARRRTGARDALAALLAALLLVRFAALGALSIPWFWAILAAAAASSVPAWPSRLLSRRLAPAAAAASLLALPFAVPPLRAARLESRAGVYELFYETQGRAWSVVDAASRDRAMTVAYAGTAVVYPLFGPRLDNRVLYVPLSDADRPTRIDLGESDPRLYLALSRARRTRFDEPAWLHRLADARVDLLFIARDDSRADPAPELDAARRHPDRFHLLFSENDVHVFRLR